MKLFFAILLIITSIHLMYGQNAPVTVAGSANNPTQGSITIPITVTNFEYIGAISLSLDYDHSVLNFVEGTQNSSIPGWFIITDNDLGNGFHRILMGWYGNGISLPDGSSIMDIEFTYISGSTTLAWYDQGGNCEYADGDSEVLNDIPTSNYYINGDVCGELGTPDTIIGNNAVCQGETGVLYSTNSIANANGYNWTVPSGATIVTGQNTTAISVDYSNTAVSGIITVEGFNACQTGSSEQLSITVNSLPIADAGEDITIPYETSTTLSAASGGSGDYTYSWTPIELLENPNVQNPQTVLLTNSDLFTVSVTDDETSCQNSDSIFVSISGGPLTVNPVVAPEEICVGETAQLFTNAGGGSGNYIFQWTSIPPGDPAWSSGLENPVVSPDSSRIYQVEIYDGFTTTDGQTNLDVHDLPTAFLSGGDTLCGEEASTILSVDLTGTPPWSVSYSYGSTTNHLSEIDESPYLINTSDSGTYVLLEVTDNYCFGSGSGIAVVEKYPIPATPAISNEGNDLFSDVEIGNQWYLDGILIEGATEQTFTATVSGDYFNIASINGCSSNTSNIINLTIVGENKIYFNTFKISPNPANDFIKLSYINCQEENLKVNFYNSYGFLIDNIELRCSGNEVTKHIDISHLKSGLYFININNDKHIDVNKLIVF